MKVVIPKPDSPFRSMIAKGSGIVMLPMEHIPNMQMIYYEGNLYGAIGLESYENRIRCAAGRAIENYPTSAMCGVLSENFEQFVVVGECYPDKNYKVSFYDSPEIIQEWLS